MSESKIEIHYNNLAFCVSNIPLEFRHKLHGFLKQFEVSIDPVAKFKSSYNNFYGRGKSKAYKFYCKTKDNDEIWLIKAYLPHFFTWMGKQGFTRDDFDVYELHLPKKVHKLNLKINKDFTPRPEQQPFIDWILGSNDHNLLSLTMGGGKTFISTYCALKLNLSTVIVTRAQWTTDKWLPDLLKLTNVKKDEIVVISGTYSLNSLFDHYLNGGKPYKFIIFSNAKLRNFIKAYENTEDFDNEWTYSIYPYELMETLKAGTLLIDEVHLDFNFNYRLLCFINATKVIAMSGTYDSDNPDIKNIQHSLFPPEKTLMQESMESYVDIYEVKYAFNDFYTIRDTDFKGPKGYSQHKFENFIRYRSNILRDYSAMILEQIKEHYLANKKDDGDKCLIYFGSIILCTYFNDYLQYHLKDLRVSRYVEDDEYEQVLNSEVICSTLLSSGTAFDIPGLITIIQTVALSSTQSNLQSYGRLRNIKDRKLSFIYLWAANLDTHYNYMFKRSIYFSERAKSYNKQTYTSKLGGGSKYFGKGEYSLDKPESVFMVYAIDAYIIKNNDSIIKQLEKTIEDIQENGDVRARKSLGWRRRNLYTKKDEKVLAERREGKVLKLRDILLNLKKEDCDDQD